MASSTIKSPHHTGTFVTIAEPTLTRHNHPQSVITLRFSLGVLSIWFGQMYNDMNIALFISVIVLNMVPFF